MRPSRLILSGLAASVIALALPSCRNYEPGYGKGASGEISAGVWEKQGGGRVQFIPYDKCSPRHRRLVDGWLDPDSEEHPRRTR